MLVRTVRAEREFPGLEEFIMTQQEEYLRELARELTENVSTIAPDDPLEELSDTESCQTQEEEPSV